MYHSVAAISALLALGTRQIEAQVVLATDCYFKSDNSVHLAGTANPCGVVTPTTNFTSCCVAGDTCLQNGICHYTHPMPSPPVVETGYYIGGCTDLQFSSPACPPQCSDLNLPDVVYIETTQTWHCCGLTNGSVRCDIPSDETFTAPAPSLLSATFTVATTPLTAAASPSPTSSTTVTTTTPLSAPTQTPGGTGNSGGLSGGAKAGIGIGCAVVALAGLGILIWFFARRRNMHAMEKQNQEFPYISYPQKSEVPVELPEKALENKRETIRAELG